MVTGLLHTKIQRSLCIRAILFICWGSIWMLGLQPAHMDVAAGKELSQIGGLKAQARSLEEVTEDISQLSLEGSRLFPVKPFLIQKDQQDGFIREFISVQWRPRDEIYLYVILPIGAAKPPAILYLYSHPSDLNRFKDDRYCRMIAAGGAAGVGFCSALTGHRYKNRPMKEWFVSELREAVVITVHDILMVLDYLKERGDVDISRTGMFGQGSGGTIAILAAALDPRIRAVDVINPWGDWPEWMSKSSLIPEAERPDFLKQDYLSRISALDPIQWLPRIADRPMRLQLIMSDPLNPDVCLRRIEISAPKGAVVEVYKNTRTHADALENRNIFDWIKRALTDSRPEAGKSQEVMRENR
jgi:hypothetical protein